MKTDLNVPFLAARLNVPRWLVPSRIDGVPDRPIGSAGSDRHDPSPAFLAGYLSRLFAGFVAPYLCWRR